MYSCQFNSAQLYVMRFCNCAVALNRFFWCKF